MDNREFFNVIQLAGHVPDSPPVAFLRAEVHKERHLPFVRIRYALYGKEQDDGLILDLHKMTFLDQVTDEKSGENVHEIVNKAAPAIAEFVGSRVYNS